MSAALTIAVLLALSTTIVRVASVALRHTGVPDHIARFQTVSALSGAGFTTNETEMIVNHPLRRRIITAAIIAGNAFPLFVCLRDGWKRKTGGTGAVMPRLFI